MDSVLLVRRTNTPGVVGRYMTIVTYFGPNSRPLFYDVIQDNSSRIHNLNWIKSRLNAGLQPQQFVMRWRRFTRTQMSNALNSILQHFKPLRGSTVSRNRPAKRSRTPTTNSNRNN